MATEVDSQARWTISLTSHCISYVLAEKTSAFAQIIPMEDKRASSGWHFINHLFLLTENVFKMPVEPGELT